MAILPDLTAAMAAPSASTPAPAKRNGKPELDWVEFNPDTFSPELKAAIDEYRAVEDMISASYKKVSALMNAKASLPAGYVLRISLKWKQVKGAIDVDGRSKRGGTTSLEALARQISNAHNQSLKIAK